MYFSTALFSLVASAALAKAATIKFVTLDDTERNVIFTCNPGDAEIPEITVSKSHQPTINFPEEWSGNFWAYPTGGDATQGMLGEVTFTPGGMTSFDISAIVDPTDTNDVKMLFPAEAKTPVSGCESMLCDNLYMAPNDIQTKTTMETALIATLGEGHYEF